ncbi:MAG TPA: PTS transporter subunit EIIB, partial [Clostridia bacterium]|nr:PTS transporter subunit EIIB [Clostridia bacterium]
MAGLKIGEISLSILEKVGGKENIAAVTHCATRLRLTLKDPDKALKEQIKKTEGVLGLVEQSGQLQIIFGPGTVGKVAAEFGKLAGISIDVEDEVKVRKEALKAKNNTPFKLFLKHISNIFIPLIPAFVGCGV